MARYNPKLANETREEIRKWDDYWRFNVLQYHEISQFIMGDQWREDEARVFETYKKIPLTFNKMAPLINSLIGEQRQNTPQLQVTPSSNTPEEAAEVREALVKEISLNSDAKIIYQTAFQQAAIGGFGAFCLNTEYDSNYSFDQNIIFKGFKDPTRCYWDISAEDQCKVMGLSSGYRTRMSRKKFRAMHGRRIEQAIGSSGNDDSTQGFWDDDQITVIDRYKRKYKRGKLYMLSNGRNVDEDEFARLERITIDGNEILMDRGMPVMVEKEREIYRYKIKHYQIAGDFELDADEFPSESLPVIFVDQFSYYDKHGKQICRPFLKDARDAQRYINYLGTQMAYLTKISRYDQFIASKANVKSNDTRQIWTDPAVVQGALLYDVDPAGNVPQQLKPPEISQSLSLQFERAIRDIHECTGMYTTQLGEKGNEVSGAAIDARTKRGSYNTFVPFDSLNRAIACAGMIVDEMIPKVYDSERLMMLNMPDTGMRKVELNKPMDDYGMQVQNDMTKGHFKIRLMPGPSYEGQKMEYLDALKMVLQADPQLFNLIGDLYVENLPLANNIQLRNRIRTLVPPEIIEAGKTGKPMPPKPPQPDPQQMLMQLKQQELQMKMQQVQQQTQAKMQEIALKQQELQAKVREMDVKAMQEYQRLETERLEAAAELQSQELRYQAELHRSATDLNIAHADNMVKLLTHGTKMHHEITKGSEIR